MPFKSIGYCKTEVLTENSSQIGEEFKIYDFTAPNGVISTMTNVIAGFSAHKAICSQLETLEKRAIICNFILYSCEGRQHFHHIITRARKRAG